MKFIALGSMASGLLLNWYGGAAAAASTDIIDLARTGGILMITGIVLLTLGYGRAARNEAVAPQVAPEQRRTRDGKVRIMVADQ